MNDIETIARALWASKPHTLLERGGYPTDWDRQPTLIKKGEYRQARAAMAVLGPHTMAEYQRRTTAWLSQCFTPPTTTDMRERAFRFLEEALELVQALGCTEQDVSTQAAYTFARPAGAPSQEVGGVMVTLAALCGAGGIDLAESAGNELDRVHDPDVMARIREKHATKPHPDGVLPGGVDTRGRVLDALRYVAPPDTRDEWLWIGHAIKTAFADDDAGDGCAAA